MLFLLLACSGDDDDIQPASNGCGAGPQVAIVSPQDLDHFDVGEEITFEATGEGDGTLMYTWGVDSNSFATGSTVEWTVTEGLHIVSVRLEDDCDSATDSLSITGDPVATDNVDDTGGPDDTGDTAPPAQPSQVVYDSAAGVPNAAWRGLAVAPDGTVWAAGSEGLVHLDPEAGSARVYGVDDGLLDSAPYSVLPHTDGTIWVGHYGDSTRQGEQVILEADGSLTLVRVIDFTETSEIVSAYRIQEQAHGAGVGEVWMGTNEGLCVFDPGRDAFYEHAHPDHPHGYTGGVAMTDDATIWNGDQYHLTRWTYAQDGALSPSVGSANFMELMYLWPVVPETDPISITDLASSGSVVWVTSSAYGVARVAAGQDGVPSESLTFGAPWPSSANAVGVDDVGDVWVGAVNGLYRWDGADLQHWAGAAWLPNDNVQQIAVDAERHAVWLATPRGLVRLVGVPD